MKKTLSAVIATAILSTLLVLTGCPSAESPNPTTVTLTSLSVNPAAANLNVGQTRAVTVTGSWSNGETTTISDGQWASNDTGVATVDSGLITAVSDGTAVITVTSGTKEASVSVTVETITAPTAIFSDSALTYVLTLAEADVEYALLTSWESGDTWENTDNTTALKVTFNAHPSGWSGAAALVQKPSTYIGNYDLSNVESIIFKIRSADIDPGNLTLVAQPSAGADRTSTLAALGVTAMTDWVEVTVPVATIFGDVSTASVKTALAFFWGSSAGDTTSLTGGESFEIGDIDFVDSDGNQVNFYSGVSLPEPASGPADRPAAPTPDPIDVISLYNSTATYTDIAVSTWQTGWSTNASVTDVAVDGANVKRLTFLDPNGYNGVDIPATNIGGRTTLYFDYWTDDGTALAIKVVDFGADGAYGGGDDVDLTVPLASVTQDAWTQSSLNYSALATLEHISQLVLVGNNGAALQNFYLDNVYFAAPPAP